MKDSIVLIGNGFDLNHGLKTAYSDFHHYLVVNDLLTEDIKSLYSLYYDDRFWFDFEENLVNIDLNYTYEVLSVGKFAPFYINEEKIRIITKTTNELLYSKSVLNGLFSKWIKSINVYSCFNLFNIFCKKKTNKRSIFITFNYTSILEKIYSIDERCILHIHGSVDDPIIGCGKSNYDYIMSNVIDLKTHPVYLSIEEFASKCIKPTDKLIEEKLISFLNRFQNETILKIYVLGHSLNHIDYPYFSYIK